MTEAPLFGTLCHPGAEKIAYLSMEIALEPEMPTYSGGLGVLAGDMLRSAADLGVPIIGISLLYRKGYFRQSLDARGQQFEQPDQWDPTTKLRLLGRAGSVQMEGHQVQIAVWQYDIVGASGHTVPVYLLDSDVPENSTADRALTDCLYGGDNTYRLRQEALLGAGARQAIVNLGHEQIRIYHMNEGHSALLAVALLEERLGGKQPNQVTDADIQAVRKQCVFTTHTPVPAGHDKFSRDLVNQVLGPERAALLDAAGAYHDGMLNMTYLALRFSHYVNGVAMHHGEVSRGMFPDYPVRAITNGVHAASWIAPAFQSLYDKHIPEWRRDNLYLRYAVGISTEEIRQSHLASKRALLEAVRQATGTALDEKILTIGFARRAATYKRPELLFSSVEKLKWIAGQVGPFQVIYAGKAHPHDEPGKDAIRKVYQAAEALRGKVPVVYLENYDVRWARLLTSGADLWLNTPKPPQEASGTSGMKAALNGVPSLSVMDGWWVEGHIEGVTGWEIGNDEADGSPEEELASLYGKLEWVILPHFYQRPDAYARIMRSCIAINGSFFNTQRMVAQYVANAYGQV